MALALMGMKAVRNRWVNRDGGNLRPLNIAHRGASAVAPPNTLAAFEKALEIGGLPLGREAEFQIELGWCRYFFDGCEAAVPHFEAALDLLKGKEDQGYWSLVDQAWEGLDACKDEGK